MARVHVGQRRRRVLRPRARAGRSRRPRAGRRCASPRSVPAPSEALARRGHPRRPRAGAIRRRVVARRVPRSRRRRARACCSRARRPRATCCPKASPRAATRSTCSRCTGRFPSRPIPPTSRACAPARSTRSRSRRRRPSRTSATRSARSPATQPSVISIGPVTSQTARDRGLQRRRRGRSAHHRRARRRRARRRCAVVRPTRPARPAGTIASCRSPNIACAGCGARPHCGGWSPSIACASTISSRRCS